MTKTRNVELRKNRQTEMGKDVERYRPSDARKVCNYNNRITGYYLNPWQDYNYMIYDDYKPLANLKWHYSVI